jgi:proteasome assembly chaperone 3
MADSFNINGLQEQLNLPFPAPTKQVAGLVKGIQTDVICMKFSDRILMTISQKGRIGHWVRSPKPILSHV